MKKSILLLSCFALITGLTNCSGSKAEEKSPAAGENASSSSAKLSVVVKPKSDYVVQGSEYSAEIFLSQDLAANTTLEVTPESGANGKTEVQKDRIVYSTLAENPGSQNFSGNVVVTKANGEKETLPFKSEYMVARRSAAIVTKYLIKGIENPLSVSVNGIPPTAIKVEASEGTLTGKMGSYKLIPGKTGKCTVTVKAEINNELKTIDTYDFEVIEKK